MCLARSVSLNAANADDEMAEHRLYPAGENGDTINPLLNNHRELQSFFRPDGDTRGQPVPK